MVTMVSPVVVLVAVTEEGMEGMEVVAMVEEMAKEVAVEILIAGTRHFRPSMILLR
jgi:hypothetical protein